MPSRTPLEELGSSAAEPIDKRLSLLMREVALPVLIDEIGRRVTEEVERAVDEKVGPSALVAGLQVPPARPDTRSQTTNVLLAIVIALLLAGGLLWRVESTYSRTWAKLEILGVHLSDLVAMSESHRPGHEPDSHDAGDESQ